MARAWHEKMQWCGIAWGRGGRARTCATAERRVRPDKVPLLLRAAPLLLRNIRSVTFWVRQAKPLKQHCKLHVALSFVRRLFSKVWPPDCLGTTSTRQDTYNGSNIAWVCALLLWRARAATNDMAMRKEALLYMGAAPPSLRLLERTLTVLLGSPLNTGHAYLGRWVPEVVAEIGKGRLPSTFQRFPTCSPSCKSCMLN